MSTSLIEAGVDVDFLSFTVLFADWIQSSRLRAGVIAKGEKTWRMSTFLILQMKNIK